MLWWQTARTRLGRAERWLSLDGRLRVTRGWALAPGPLALILASAFPSRWLLYIAYVYLLVTLAAYLWVRAGGPAVTLRRQLRGAWAQVGDELEEEWQLENRAALPLLWLEIEDGSTLPGYSARRVIGAGPGDQQKWRTAARCERRGAYQLGPLVARLGDPLGLFVFEWPAGQPLPIVIYPPLVRLPPLALPRGHSGGLAQADLLQIHTTPSVGGLRAYVPGDPPSRIHWPYVARHGQLIVKQFDQERAGALWIVLDLAGAAYAAAGVGAPPTPQPTLAGYSQSSVAEASATESRPGTLLELAVVLASSLAALALAEGRAVGLLAEDGRRRLVTPGGGQRQLWRIMGELVDAEADGARPLGELLRQGARATLAGSALVIITPALDGAWLPALAECLRGRPGGALALLPTVSSAVAAPLLARLAAQGTPAHPFDLGHAMPFARPPRRAVRARVSPLGRVIREGS